MNIRLKGPAVILVVVTLVTASSFYVFSANKLPARNDSPLQCCIEKIAEATPDSTPKGCVFKTLFEGEYLDSDFMYQTPENVKAAIQEGLQWMIREQLADGGWSGGFHTSQQILKDPNAKSDPGTTAMVAMALLRCGTDPQQGPYLEQLNKATEYLLNAVDQSPEKALNITSITGTQPQVKLGANIDVMLTSQYLTNILSYFGESTPQYTRIKTCVDKCVDKIQKSQNDNGSFQGSGWAGVLQSSIANNALESAASVGIAVDTVVLEQSRNYQKDNYNTSNGAVSTADGAGIVLYSLSSTGRASAKEANEAKKIISKAKKEGKIKTGDTVNADNLMKAGLSSAQAYKYSTAFTVNAGAAKLAQSDVVMTGFGSNGGEEFYSFLQTGEGLIISRDTAWKQWYANVSGKLIKIQEKSGNWQGHHCITSPVFCTATCLLILSVNNDLGRLVAMGN